jgi:hypothetical protein
MLWEQAIQKGYDQQVYAGRPEKSKAAKDGVKQHAK